MVFHEFWISKKQREERKEEDRNIVRKEDEDRKEKQR
jgi:hypothetical protein